MVATATASGKSLCYKIPAFQNALARASRRAIFLYPTKALAQDQLGKIKAFGLRGVHPATYDGDTPHALRADIRRKANILLTNPDMLNIGILPNHEVWADFLRNLEIVAVDEAHVLRGVFGSHVAAVLRRLRRVAMLHGGDPKFVLTSATIANPQELAESLTGLPFSLVDNDGASTGERRVVFRNPPLLDKEKGERRSLLTEGALVFANLVSQGVRTIAFAKSRKSAELIYRYAADRLGVDGARRISPYRAGYTPTGTTGDRGPPLPRRPARRRLDERAGAGGGRGRPGRRGLLRLPGKRRLHLAAVGPRGTRQGPRPRRVHRRPRLARPVPHREPAAGTGPTRRGRAGHDGEPLHPRAAPARGGPRGAARRRRRGLFRASLQERGEVDDGGQAPRVERRPAGLRRRGQPGAQHLAALGLVRDRSHCRRRG